MSADAPSPDAARLRVDLTGQTAIVTGASRGIGRAIAMRLASSGARVACVARSRDKLDEVVAAIASAGGEGAAMPADVADSASATRLVDEVVERWGRLDILVNNAGVTRDTLLPRMSDEDWDEVLATNLRSVFLFTRAAAGAMIRGKRGRIVSISSVSGLRGNPGQANYSASKAGIVGFTQTVAKELASRRRAITVNAVCPGFIESDMTEKLGDALLDAVKERVPLQRLGTAQEVADAVLFLASESASYITGQVLTIDGGMTC